MATAQLYIFNVKIERIVDGDTVDVTIDLGFDVYIKERVRLYGVDTPELNSSNAAEREYAKRATERATELMPPGQWMIMKSQEFRRGKYGRVLGTFMTPDGRDVGQVLIQEGHAEPY